MDELEKLISENRASFDDGIMPAGHMKRFEDRLKPVRKPIVKMLSPWIAAAAVLAIVLLVALPRNNQPEVQLGALSQVSDEYREVEYYFTSSISNRVDALNQMAANGYASADDQKLVQDELAELEQRHQQLLSDLKLAPDDDRIINAMIEVYRKKLQLINSILDQLNEVKKRKEEYKSQSETDVHYNL